MAVLGGENTLVTLVTACDMFFYGILKKQLAQSVRIVSESNVDVQTHLYVAICNEFVRSRAQIKRRNVLERELLSWFLHVKYAISFYQL